MNKSLLAEWMLKWERKKRELDELETAIHDTILQLGETVEVGNVKAQYRQGRKSYDYEAVGSDASDALREQFTKTMVKVDWRKLVLDGMGIEQNQIPFTESDPSVSIKLLS